MIPVSLLPAVLHITGHLYAVAAVFLGLGYLWYSVSLVHIVHNPLSDVSRRHAHDLLRVSIVYLPCSANQHDARRQGTFAFLMKTR
jgi:heme O synthase-like polyprenyltransferase